MFVDCTRHNVHVNFTRLQSGNGAEISLKMGTIAGETDSLRWTRLELIPDGSLQGLSTTASRKMLKNDVYVKN